MSVSFQQTKSQTSIQKLLSKIGQATKNMNNTFEQTVLRHEQQFIKCYRVKIQELVKLLDQLKSTIQDSFINNTLAVQLQTVIKQRDYFKYQCLKLNNQHQSLLDDHKNLTSQASNSSQQITIYKHLLQTQKIKSAQIQKNAEKMKKNLNQLAMKSIPEPKYNQQNKIPEFQKQMVRLKRQIRDRNEIIRALRERVFDMEKVANTSHVQRVEKKQLYELWRVCMQSWKRQLQKKSKKENTKLPTVEQMSSTSKKQLLKLFFTHGEFLRFIERLIFDNGFRVIFESSQQNFMEKNRAKLMNYMTKKRIHTSQQRPFRN